MLTGSAFVFPGQGSQHPGMARDLTACGPTARDLVSVAEQTTGKNLTALMTNADAATIADPAIAQLLVFVSSSVLLAELRERGREPAVVAGHSLGEYTALAACGSLDWHTALALVMLRGKVMADAARQRPGTMGAVVGLDLDRVTRMCEDAAGRHGTVVVANVNSARQIVVSGTTEAVLAVLEAAAAAGALRARRIPVGGAYHSSLMDTAQRQLAPSLRRAPLAPPRIPFVSSVTGELVTDVEEYRTQLVAQVTRPVLWHAVTRRLAELEPHALIEVGPGRVLAGLGRETIRGARHLGAVEAIRGLAAPATVAGRKAPVAVVGRKAPVAVAGSGTLATAGAAAGEAR
jgi:[acyl-carrier-protein] S-malonyltransferase